MSETRVDILTEIVVVRERMLDRCLDVQHSGNGSISDDEVDRARLDLLEARLRLAEATGGQ